MQEKTLRYLVYKKEVGMSRVQEDIRSVVEKQELFDYFSNSTIFITGATGFIGSMLIKTFLMANDKWNLNFRVVGQIRNAEKAKDIFGEQVDRIELSMTDDIKADYIIHTVSPTTSKYFIENPVETIKVSIESTISILDVAKNIIHL